MRSTPDRIRHALSFEITALLIVIPLGALGFGLELHDIGVVAVVSSTIATLWNYVYNILFDHTMMRLKGYVAKTLRVRIVHTLLFEVGLLLALIPFIAWYLGMTIWQAFLLDLTFALFYLVYTFVFNWAYDTVFPIPS